MWAGKFVGRGGGFGLHLRPRWVSARDERKKPLREQGVRSQSPVHSITDVWVQAKHTACHRTAGAGGVTCAW